MPAIQMFCTSFFVPANTYYWDNFPLASGPYEGPWWLSFNCMLPSLKPTGRSA
jgi:peptide/nickel transport system substrate-binding protein